MCEGRAGSVQPADEGDLVWLMVALQLSCTQFSSHFFPGHSESRARDEQEVYSQRMKESLSGASPNPNSSSFGHSPSQFRSSGLGHAHSLSSAIHHNVHEWKLKTDEGLNGYVRDEFYYEQVCLQSATDLLTSVLECVYLVGGEGIWGDV